MTLHLHLLLWIKGALSPQEIRDKLVSGESVFRQELISYLESAHKGKFLTGTMDAVRAAVPMQTESRGGLHAIARQEDTTNKAPGLPEYNDPTLTLPVPAPQRCQPGDYHDCSCTACESNSQWWRTHYQTVDDLLLKSNVHRCIVSKQHLDKDRKDNSMSNAMSSKAQRVNPKQGPKGCIDSQGVCHAQFPRQLHEETKVDDKDGHLVLKKGEAYLNTFTPSLTYLF